jgi:hypothetical protein
MPERDFEIALDDEAINWIRFRFTTVGGKVTRFTAQYETMIDGERMPVMRYDNAHGVAHRDRLNRRGDVVEKTPMDVATLGEALNEAKREIAAYWRVFRADFLRNGS